MITMRAVAAGALIASFAFGGASGIAAQTPEGVPVVVQNQGFYDMHVYAVHSGIRRSLGVVTGASTQTLALPRVMTESDRDIQILADPIGGFNRFLSDPLLVTPGSQINVRLQNDASLSTVTVSDQEPVEGDAPDPDPTPSN